ncbi:hypothetical protein [Oceanirhabdus sp. W0125-5]|uniref:hypothetical protein n=1 Tax=Oceanirhabdus sp. W0125-5 TaxID=2999116 RepID=UPI0022F2ADCA|nr:hypothetical protein [Oceanirhabdus sp. W0125-5]WBW98186.1 hypothetical protein OW730_05320 [Oceanirhabdus sp. W0125-5]
MQKKISIILILLIIVLTSLLLKTRFNKKANETIQVKITNILSQSVEDVNPNMLIIIDSITKDDYQLVSYTYNNIVGFSVFKKNKNNKFEHHSSKYSSDGKPTSFTWFYGEKLSFLKYLIIYPNANKDISKIKFTINNKTFVKHVDLNKPSMITFDVNLNIFDEPVYEYKYQIFDSNDNELIE